MMLPHKESTGTLYIKQMVLPRYEAIAGPYKFDTRFSPGKRPSQDPYTLTDGDNRWCSPGKRPLQDPFTLTDDALRVRDHHWTLTH